MEQIWLFVFGLVSLLGVAALVMPLANRINFPFTVLLAIAGLIIGFATMLLGDSVQVPVFKDILQFTDEFRITPEVVMFVFLPALVFESALSIDARRLINDLGPILFLAIAGLLISAVLSGIVLLSISELSFVACLLIGAIISATDPVAVVAIFKELGAPKRLAILVEGESLFNDATAIVVFTILAAMLTGGAEPSALGGTWTFLKVFLGGILIGAVLGYLVSIGFQRLNHLPLVAMTLTIVLAYLSFILAEHFLHFSGVMAVVTAGVIVASRGQSALKPAVWHGLHEIWENIGFWANSLIFLLVGLIAPSLLINATSGELLILVALIVTAFVARAMIIYVLMPMMHRIGLGEQVSLPFKTVMFWGGLRGAVSLALALVVVENDAYDEQTRHMTGLLVTGFVLFTLFINAPSVGKVLSGFGLDKLSDRDRSIRNRAMAASLENAREKLIETARSFAADPQIIADLVEHQEQRQAKNNQDASALAGISAEDWVATGLSNLTLAERAIVRNYYANGYLSGEGCRHLLHQIDDMTDWIKFEGIQGYRKAWKHGLGFSRGFDLTMYVQQKFGYDKLLASALANRFEALYTERSVLATIYEHDLEGAMVIVGEENREQLRSELETRKEETNKALEALILQYPEYAKALEQRHMGLAAVRLEENEYAQLHQHSLISEEVYKDLSSNLSKRAQSLTGRPKLDLGLNPHDLVAKVPLFCDLDKSRIDAIVNLLKPRLALPDERIIQRGDVGDAMYFISTGAVAVDLDDGEVQLGSGEFIGEIALVMDQVRNADVTACGYCQLLELTTNDFQKLLQGEAELKLHIEETVRQRLNENS